MVAGIGDHHVNASAQFEEDLQTLQARIEDELGKDSDVSGMDTDFLLGPLVAFRCLSLSPPSPPPFSLSSLSPLLTFS